MFAQNASGCQCQYVIAVIIWYTFVLFLSQSVLRGFSNNPQPLAVVKHGFDLFHKIIHSSRVSHSCCNLFVCGFLTSHSNNVLIMVKKNALGPFCCDNGHLLWYKSEHNTIVMLFCFSQNTRPIFCSWRENAKRSWRSYRSVLKICSCGMVL